MKSFSIAAIFLAGMASAQDRLEWNAWTDLESLAGAGFDPDHASASFSNGLLHLTILCSAATGGISYQISSHHIHIHLPGSVLIAEIGDLRFTLPLTRRYTVLSETPMLGGPADWPVSQSWSGQDEFVSKLAGSEHGRFAYVSGGDPDAEIELGRYAPVDRGGLASVVELCGIPAEVPPGGTGPFSVLADVPEHEAPDPEDAFEELLAEVQSKLSRSCKAIGGKGVAFADEAILRRDRDDGAPPDLQIDYRKITCPGTRFVAHRVGLGNCRAEECLIETYRWRGTAYILTDQARAGLEP